MPGRAVIFVAYFEPFAIVAYRELQFRRMTMKMNRDFTRLRMSRHIRQRLLHDPVEMNLIILFKSRKFHAVNFQVDLNGIGLGKLVGIAANCSFKSKIVKDTGMQSA